MVFDPCPAAGAAGILREGGIGIRRLATWKYVMAAAVAAAAVGLYSLAFAAGVVQKSTLSGVVQAEGLVRVGQTVRQGDVLVQVKTLMGAMPASRATVSGTVKSVSVQAGQTISGGQAVAEIEP